MRQLRQISLFGENNFKGTLRRIMTHRSKNFEVLWLLVQLILVVTELQATTLRDNGSQAGDKRGHGPSGGAPNG